MQPASPPLGDSPKTLERARWLWPAVWLGVFSLAALALQLHARVPWDADTAYHVAVARLIREHGILQAFPWTPYSWLSDHYADKELAFHLLFVPLTSLEWKAAAQLVGTVLGAMLLWTLYLVLRSMGARLPGAWALLALASSGYFLMRLGLVRPHLASVTLAMVVAWAAARRRLWPLGAAGALYPFFYVAWHQALILAVLAELAQLLCGRRPSWRPLAAVSAGSSLGVLLHPNFPNIVRFAWIENVEILFLTAWSKKEGFELGTEFSSLVSDPPGLLAYGALPLALALASLVVGWNRRKQSPAPLAFGLSALAYGVMTLGSARFVEYLSPFCVIGLAVGLGTRAPRWLPPALAGSALAFTALFGLRPLSDMSRRAEDFPPQVAQRLQALIPGGEQVFTCNWLTTGEMMLALPDRRFVVALDPVLFWKKDPALYRRWFELVRSPPPRPSTVVREQFGARFVLCESQLPAYRPFIAAMAHDPDAKAELVSDLWVLFELSP